MAVLQELALGVAQRSPLGPAFCQFTVKSLHQPGGRTILDRPEAEHQGCCPGVEKGAHQSLQLVAATDLALPGLASAEGDQRRLQAQVKDVEGRQPAIGQGEPGKERVVRAKLSVSGQVNSPARAGVASTSRRRNSTVAAGPIPPSTPTVLRAVIRRTVSRSVADSCPTD